MAVTVDRVVFCAVVEAVVDDDDNASSFDGGLAAAGDVANVGDDGNAIVPAAAELLLL
jgi:hypothetical protein